MQYLTEQAWEEGYPSRRGPAYKITDYMKGDKSGITPIMTNSESIKQFGDNAYGKPATALNILRETIMGRDLFDHAFKTYARRWQFKHPTPADFFRTMEDASAVDLDWFWRGWFYTTDQVDINLDNVKWFKINPSKPAASREAIQESAIIDSSYITNIRNRENMPKKKIEEDTALQDFYNGEQAKTLQFLEQYQNDNFRKNLSAEEKELIESGHHYYELTFTNEGGLVMPIILKFMYADGTSEVKRIPAQIWRHNDEEVHKVFVTENKVQQVVLDPFLETADVNRDNNYWPPREEPSRFELYQEQQRNGQNLMQINKQIQQMQKSTGTSAP